MLYLLCRLRQFWISFVFILQVFAFIPFFAMAGWFGQKRGRALALKLNYLFSWLLYSITFTFPRIRYELPIDKRKAYVICANHTSFLDIPALSLTPFTPLFVGKTAVTRFVPCFKYVYQFHIHFNRGSLRGRHTAFIQASEAMKEGFHIAFFPEGGIKSKRPPTLAPFQNGAFKLAIENKVDILPIILPYNWVIAPKYRVSKPYLCPIVTHVLKPIPTAHRSPSEASKLSKEVFDTIQKGLAKYHPKPFAPHHT